MNKRENRWIDGWKIQGLTVELHLVTPCGLCRIAVPWCNPLRLLVWISRPIRARQWEGTRQLTLVNSTEGGRGFNSKTHPLLSSVFSLFLFFSFFAPSALWSACAARKREKWEKGEKGEERKSGQRGRESRDKEGSGWLLRPQLSWSLLDRSASHFWQ